MATHSGIGIELKNGEVQAIYCTFDGHVESNGRLLVDHYSGEENKAKREALIGLGDLSQLGEEIGEKHLFDNPYNYGSPAYYGWHARHRHMCFAYGRDRGESGVDSLTYGNRDEFVKHLSNYGAKYFYLWDNTQWIMLTKAGWLPVSEVLDVQKRVS